MLKKLIAQGAEAKLFLEDNKVIKNRFKKSYRIKEIDDRLRNFRTRREEKIVQRNRHKNCNSSQQHNHSRRFDNVKHDFKQTNILYRLWTVIFFRKGRGQGSGPASAKGRA